MLVATNARSADVTPHFHRNLPIPAIEWARSDFGQINTFKATHIHVDLVRVRSRHIEGMNTAGSAESVLGHFGVEFVGSEFVFATQQLKAFGRHDEMQKSFLRTLSNCTQKHAIGRQLREIGRGHSGSFPRTSSCCSPTRTYHLQRSSGLSLSWKADFISAAPVGRAHARSGGPLLPPLGRRGSRGSRSRVSRA